MIVQDLEVTQDGVPVQLPCIAAFRLLAVRQLGVKLLERAHVDATCIHVLTCATALASIRAKLLPHDADRAVQSHSKLQM